VMKMILNQIWCCCVMRVMITMLLRRLTTNSGLWNEDDAGTTRRRMTAGVAVYFFLHLDSMLWEICGLEWCEICGLEWCEISIGMVWDLWIGLSIWITAVRFDRRLELTAEVYSISRSLDVCIFNCSFCLQTSPSNLTLRFACFAGRFLRRLCSGLLLGLRSANEWKHGATRSAVASEQPSIFTLRDFVAAIAGRFLRRLCSASLYTVIGCREFGDITTDGSHYGLDTMRQDYNFYFMVWFYHCERLHFIVTPITLVFELYNPP
jgi:hypothetical protein